MASLQIVWFVCVLSCVFSEISNRDPDIFSVRLYKKAHFRGASKVQWTDDDGGCRTIPPRYEGTVESIDTFDACVVLWSNDDCTGEPLRLSRYEFGTRDLDLVSYKNQSASIQLCKGVDKKDPNPGPRPPQLKPPFNIFACSVRLYQRVEFRGPSEVMWTDERGNCSNIPVPVNATGLIRSIDTFDLCVIIWSNADCTGLALRLTRYTYLTRNLVIVRYRPRSIQICKGVDKPDPNPGPRPKLISGGLRETRPGFPVVGRGLPSPVIAYACSVRLYKRVEFRGPAKILWTDDNGGCIKIPQKKDRPLRKIRSIDTFDLCVILWTNDDCTGKFWRLSRYSFGTLNLADLGILSRSLQSIQICKGVDKPDPNHGPRPGN